MSEKLKDYSEKLKGYKERHQRWQDYAITQLGYVNNIILTISIGFMAFAFNNDKKFLETLSFSKDSEFSCKMFFYILTLICLLVSIKFGIITSLSRLYDFKITRHIALTRMRFCKFSKGEFSLPDYDFIKPKCKEIFNALFKIPKGIKLLTKQETNLLKEKPELMKKFNKLRRLSHNLGIISWGGIKMQILFLLFSLILYVISLFS